MDYCNSISTITEQVLIELDISAIEKYVIILYYIPRITNKIIENEEASLITKTKRRDHISPILRDLHWLLIKKRTDYKMMVLTFNAPNEHEPSS